MNGEWLAAAGAGSSALLVGLTLASADHARLLDRAGRPGPVVARRGRLGSPGLLRLLWPAAAFLGGLLGIAVAGVPGGGVLASAGAAAPVLVARRRRARRLRLVQEQLIEAVDVIASALRAGRSLLQALEVAGSEVGDPLGPTLQEALDRVRLGASLDEALDGWEADVGTEDTRLVAGVLTLHRRTGGALVDALEDLAGTLRARLIGARELRTLTAQARLSAAVLGLLPLGFFLFLSVTSRRDIEAAFRTTAGASAIAIGVALQTLAFFWIRSLLRVER